MDIKYFKDNSCQFKEIDKVLTLSLDINEENYLLKIYPSKDNATIIFKIEQEKVQTYYYYEKFDLRDLRQRDKKFICDENINQAFFSLKEIINKSSTMIEKKSFKIIITFCNNKGIFMDFILRKKIVSQNRLNPLLIDQIRDNNKGINTLSKKMAKIEKNINNQNNIINNINNNIDNINNNIKKIKNNINIVNNIIYKSNSYKINNKNNNINNNKKDRKIIENNVRKKDKEVLFCYKNLKKSKNKIIQILFTFNLIAILLSIYMWNSIKKLKSIKGNQKIKEEENKKKFLIMNLLNDINLNIIKNKNNKNVEQKKLKKLSELNAIDENIKKYINNENSLFGNEKEILFFKNSILNKSSNKFKDINFILKYDSFYDYCFDKCKNISDNLLIVKSKKGEKIGIFSNDIINLIKNIGNKKNIFFENSIVGYIFSGEIIDEINFRDYFGFSNSFSNILKEIYNFIIEQNIKKNKYENETKNNNKKIDDENGIEKFEIYQIKYVN